MSAAVTLASVRLGLRVVRNERDWRPKWRDDGHGPGTIVGFTDDSRTLIGRNAGREYNALAADAPAGWAVVRWDSGLESVYPVGADGPDLGSWWRGGPCYALAFAKPPVPVKDEVDDTLRDLRGLCMEPDVDDRPTMDEMCMSDSQRDYYEFS
jgi:hypothetical protein